MSKVAIVLCFCIGAIVCSLPASASANNRDENKNFYSDKERGWHWREEPQEEPLEKEEPEKAAPIKETASTQPKTDEDPQVTQFKKFQKELEDSRIIAVMNPTFENIKKYRYYYDLTLTKGEEFTKNWMMLNWMDPKYDQTVTTPVQGGALSLFKENVEQEKAQKIAEIAKRYAIVYVFDDSCVQCPVLSSALRLLQQQTPIVVDAFNTDSANTVHYPQARYAPTAALKLGVASSPAVVLINPKTKRIVPIAHSAVSVGELIDRITIQVDQLEGKPLEITNPNMRLYEDTQKKLEGEENE